MKPRIVVVGSSNTDMIIKLPHLPKPGETVLGGEFHMVNGGKGANQAIAAARAGGQVSFISCIANDSFGSGTLKHLKKEGIDETSIKIIENESSGIALINVADTGENSISVAPGANKRLMPEDIEERKSLIKSADALLIQLEIPIETVYHTIKLANSYNIPIILNPAPAQQIDPEILKLVTIITPNENEAVEISPIVDRKIDRMELVKILHKLEIDTVIITLGEKGVLYSNNGQVGHIESIKVSAVDTTAAGDTFNGYLVTLLAKGESLENAVRVANYAASISVTRMGASTSIPYMDEVLKSINA